MRENRISWADMRIRASFTRHALKLGIAPFGLNMLPEFAVVVMRVNSSTRAMIEEKIERLNETLSPIALTAGAAFSDRENPHGDILRDAGEALQKARQTMDKGCMFY